MWSLVDTKSVNHSGDMNTYLPHRNLEVDVVNYLQTFAICRARSYPNHPEYLFETLSP